MLVVDERKLSQSTIEAIGHNYGISDTGYDFDEHLCRKNADDMYKKVFGSKSNKK